MQIDVVADDGDEGVEAKAGDVRVGAVVLHGLHQEAHQEPRLYKEAHTLAQPRRDQRLRPSSEVKILRC